MEVFVTLARLLLASVFLMAGWTKLRDPSFPDTIRNFRILPPWSVAPFARILPWTELSVGAALFWGVSIQLASAILLALLGCFLVASMSAIKRKLNFQCRCFGLLYKERISSATVLRDVILIGIALSVLLLDNGVYSFAESLRNGTTATGWIITLITLLTLIFTLRIGLSASGDFRNSQVSRT